MSGTTKILVISCGGTISSTQGDNVGVVPSLTSEQLVNNIPDLSMLADIATLQFRQLASSEISISDVLDLSRLINESEYDGYVITHGTDSIEETAFSLDLLYTGSNPVVITGAMRHPGLQSADGNANIMAAVITACNPASKDLGVLVVMNESVYAARFVTKAHASKASAFRSRIGGSLGWICENELILSARLRRLTGIDVNEINTTLLGHTPAVPIIKSFSGDDGHLMATINESQHYPGIVIDALGGGHVSNAMARQIEKATQTMHVIITTRTGSGTTLTATYGYPGSEIDLSNKGAIMAGWLSAVQARIFLELLILTGKNSSQIRHNFATL